MKTIQFIYSYINIIDMSNNKTNSLPENAHKYLTTEEFYDLVAEEVENGLKQE